MRGMTGGMMSSVFGVWTMWMIRSAAIPTTAAAANEPMDCGRPNSSMMTLRMSMVMIPSTATMASSFFGVLNMTENPPAASAAAIA